MKVLILAGGSGTRLWPLSTSNRPKQFIKLLNSKYSLFQQTFLRALKLANKANIFIITNCKYKDIALEQIYALGIDFKNSNIIAEPIAKNTLPAITYGVINSTSHCEDNIVVFPSDNKIENEDKFISIIKSSEKLAQNSIVTFGIKPTHPNTGYGYIAPGDKILNGYSIKQFKEKPNEEKAKEYIQFGYLWNTGIFMFNSKVFINETKKYALDIYNAIISHNSLKESYENIKKGISIDYGLMEFTQKGAVVPCPIGWNDLGSFDAFEDVFEKDSQENIAYNKEILIEAKNNLVISESNEKVVMVGVDNLIVVSHNGGLLICKKNQASKLKEVVNTLKKKDASFV